MLVLRNSCTDLYLFFIPEIFTKIPFPLRCFTVLYLLNCADLRCLYLIVLSWLSWDNIRTM